ncbi:CmpA/NrtA family ABC transporter substrate-binding protein [Magnetospirillum sulfuroxidans]|uniref:ABC transporter substrate-binding protein n=1 Tax=Magnetospirillum sulfuroxidans TaxID=611300 RepID=A0ABS5I9D2_9PROT|nr:CmpA/NrtA family ABC transporter substrate-binding protein [Magnetospirillum sulfuroxidans]MBR9971015.1 ABC transporter substrate-binding protein [Magnetospirillum sulfuroxidans]
MTLELNRLKLGIVPLMDAAPIVVAKERGFFAEQGLDVDISREPSWANIRDKVAVGALDGAQMLAPMPLSMSLGLGAIREPVITGLALNLGGNTITLSAALCHRLLAQGGLTGAALKQVIADDKLAGRPALAFAMVYPFSTHNYELRFWLAAAGIDPDRDVRLTVVPPPQMIGHMSAGNIAGFCVGEPWGSLAASMDLGTIVATSDSIFAGRLEKVLGVTRAWADSHPETHNALIKAVLAAASWCEANRGETADIMAQPAYVNVPRETARAALTGPQAPHFSAHCANFPWRSQAMWYLTQMQRWGQLSHSVDLRRIAEEVYRPDLFRLAALELGLPVPLIDHKSEGGHAQPWILDKATAPIAMGPDLMLGGVRFDPAPGSETPAQPEHAEGLS